MYVLTCCTRAVFIIVTFIAAWLLGKFCTIKTKLHQADFQSIHGVYKLGVAFTCSHDNKFENFRTSIFGKLVAKSTFSSQPASWTDIDTSLEDYKEEDGHIFQQLGDYT